MASTRLVVVAMVALLAVSSCGDGDAGTSAAPEAETLTAAEPTSAASESMTTATPPTTSAAPESMTTATPPGAAPSPESMTTATQPGAAPPSPYMTIAVPQAPPTGARALCPTMSTPVVAAFDLEVGELRWVACLEGTGLYMPEAATGDSVYVARIDQSTGNKVVIAYDASSGEEQWRGGDTRLAAEVGDDADRPVRDLNPTIDDVVLSGGQQESLAAVDASTGGSLWEQPAARLAYDDVWAVGDGAVYAVENDGTPNMELVAYELRTGDVRWRRPLSEPMYPWHVAGDRLFAMWNNLNVIDTNSGNVVWETVYPIPTDGFPRLFGAVANDDTVFVTFTTETSGGD